MIVRNDHVVFEPNEIEDQDPGDHDDGVAKAVDRWLKALELGYGKPVFDMMMGRLPPGGDVNEADRYMARIRELQRRAHARMRASVAELRASLGWPPISEDQRRENLERNLDELL